MCVCACVSLNATNTNRGEDVLGVTGRNLLLLTVHNLQHRTQGEGGEGGQVRGGEGSGRESRSGARVRE